MQGCSGAGNGHPAPCGRQAGHGLPPASDGGLADGSQSAPPASSTAAEWQVHPSMVSCKLRSASETAGMHGCAPGQGVTRAWRRCCWSVSHGESACCSPAMPSRAGASMPVRPAGHNRQTAHLQLACHLIQLTGAMLYGRLGLCSCLHGQAAAATACRRRHTV